MSDPQSAPTEFPSYDAAIDWLMSFADFERGSLPRRSRPMFALDRIRSLLRRMGDPQHGRPTVHIAGSKGKGSTAAMIESCLRAAGLRTGLFTSPHLHSFCERIRINGEPLDEQLFAALAAELRAHTEADLAAQPGHVSTFELLTALSFSAFAAQDAQVQIVEVGLGGRLDCTNVFGEKDAAVITSLSHEHTDILGDRIEQIAAEKAGILTAGTHVAVLAPQRSEAAAAVVRNAADDLPAPLVEVAASYEWTPAGVEPWGQWFRLKRLQPRPGEPAEQLLLTPLLGDFQIENAATAVAALDLLRAQGHDIPVSAIHTGLATVQWPGRLEELQWPETLRAGPTAPRLVVDGAHNGESVRRALDALNSYFPHKRLIVVLGVLGDKALDAIAAAVSERAAAVVLTASDHPRSRSAADLTAAFADWDGSVAIAPSVESALAAARELAGADDLVAVLGSLSLAANARECLRRPEALPTDEPDASPAAERER